MSFTLGSFLISMREIFHARWTTQESERSRRAASSLISWSIDSGKYRLCFRLSVFEPCRFEIDSLSLVAKAASFDRGGDGCVRPPRASLHESTATIGCLTAGIKLRRVLTLGQFCREPKPPPDWSAGHVLARVLLGA